MNYKNKNNKIPEFKMLIKANGFAGKLIGALKKTSFFMKLYRKLYVKFSAQSFNRKCYSEKIKNNPPIGILKEKRNCKIIISLTSYPKRLALLQYTLYSLLNQECQADEVILWLTKEELPLGEKNLPQEILNLKKYGLKIKWCNNLRSYNKLLPSLETYRDSIIVTADDDIYYPESWLMKLVDVHNKYPTEIICHRAHRITFEPNNSIAPYNSWNHETKEESSTYRNFLTGVGGVLYPKNSLSEEVNRKDLIEKLSPLADDIWFWAMAILKGTKIRLIKDGISKLTYVDLENEINWENTLAGKNVMLGENDKQLRAIIDYYPEVLNRLYNE